MKTLAHIATSAPGPLQVTRTSTFKAIVKLYKDRTMKCIRSSVSWAKEEGLIEEVVASKEEEDSYEAPVRPMALHYIQKPIARKWSPSTTPWSQ